MNVTRNYVHRTFGPIGSVELVAPKGKWMLDGQELPESSVSHLVTFALQTLQDAYAGSENAAEAVAAFESKRDRLIAGTLGTRGSGTGATEEQIVTRSIVRSAMKARLGSKSPEWAEFTGLSDEAQLEKLDAVAAANVEVFAEAIAAKMAERAREREQKARLAKAATFNI